MTKEGILDDRRAALEDEFFHREEQKKLAAMRDKLQAQATKEELRKASGMADDGVLDQLVALGMNAQTVASMSLVPLLMVAWADGQIQDHEREAILKGANDKGLASGSSGHQLLDAWLNKKPDPRLFEAWESYIHALVGEIKGDEARNLRKEVVRLATQVAESAGGFLGMRTVSKDEATALARIAKAFEP